MNKSLLRKGLVLGIIVLFVGATTIPSINGYNQNKNHATQINNHTPASSSNNYWWPMHRYDVTNSGFSMSDGPETNSVLWFNNLGVVMRSTPAIVEDRLYIGAEDDNNFYCVDALTGIPIWNYTTDGPVESSPAVYNNSVYFGSNDHRVYCLDTLTGTKSWEYVTGEPIYEYSPTVVGGRVYIGSHDGNMYCLNAETGEYIWHKRSTPSTTPAVYNDRVYFGSWDNNVYCLDAYTGSIIWNFPTGHDMHSTPAVINGKVYVGSFDFQVYCLNATTGEMIWNTNIGSYTWSSPAVAYERVYIGSDNDIFYCLDANTGNYLWNYSTGGNVCSPAVADGKVYFSSNDYYVYCLDAITGEDIWEYETSQVWYYSPVIANGKLYIFAAGLYCFRDNTNPERPTIMGLQSGMVKQSYNFTVSSSDPDNDSLFYYIDWGDDTVTDWDGPYPSGQEVIFTHTWLKTGDYRIRVKAKDIIGGESPFSYPFDINITGPRFHIEFSGGLGVQTTITNIGVTDATNVSWRVENYGGFTPFELSTYGEISDDIKINESVIVHSYFFGIGNSIIFSAYITCDEGETGELSKIGYLFLLFVVGL